MSQVNGNRKVDQEGFCLIRCGECNKTFDENRIVGICPYCGNERNLSKIAKHKPEVKIDDETNKTINQIRNDVKLASEAKCLYYLDGGVGDIIEVYKDKVIIKHEGVINFLAMGLKGDKVILISDITSVQLKKAVLAAGYLQLSLPGGMESTGGLFRATLDENTITFGNDRDNNEVAEKIKKYIEEYRIALRQPNAKSIENKTSVADELLKFKQLLDAGMITQEEFEKQKSILLSN